MRPLTSPCAEAVSTRASTESRDDTSTVVGADVESGVPHDGGRPIRFIFTQVGQDDVLACAHAPSNSLSDRPRPRDHDDVVDSVPPQQLGQR